MTKPIEQQPTITEAEPVQTGDIVEKLREWSAAEGASFWAQDDAALIGGAADEICRLRAEVSHQDATIHGLRWEVERLRIVEATLRGEIMALNVRRAR